MYSIISAHRTYEAFWTSATDQDRKPGEFFWDSTGDSINYNNWDTAEPNNLEEERCVEVRSVNRKWNNVPCSNSYLYICEGFKKR
jgi:Lectin C-type domain